MVVSVICSFIMDMSGHLHQIDEALCMFNGDWSFAYQPKFFNSF